MTIYRTESGWHVQKHEPRLVGEIREDNGTNRLYDDLTTSTSSIVPDGAVNVTVTAYPEAVACPRCGFAVDLPAISFGEPVRCSTCGYAARETVDGWEECE